MKQCIELRIGTKMVRIADETCRVSVEMEAQDGTLIMMKNKHVWRTVGPKGQMIHSIE